MHILYVFYLYHTGKARLLFKTDLDRDRSGLTCNLKLKFRFLCYYELYPVRRKHQNIRTWKILGNLKSPLKFN